MHVIELVVSAAHSRHHDPVINYILDDFKTFTIRGFIWEKYNIRE